MGQKKVELYFNLLTPWNHQFPNPNFQYLEEKKVKNNIKRIFNNF
jgi:hypothetical protein